jgi:uncharacterized protein
MMKVRKPTQEEIQKAQTWPVWEKEPSEFPWEYGQRETCYIVEGSATVTADNGETTSFQTGDWVIFEPGLTCTWNIHERIKKHYTFG